jgi:hypothetical protein
MAAHSFIFAVGCDVNHIRLFPLGPNLRSPRIRCKSDIFSRLTEKCNDKKESRRT